MESDTKHKINVNKIVLIIGIIILLTLVVLLYNPQIGIPVPQQAQFNAINTALELFKYEFDDYSPSDALDKDAKPYCGAMKLAEAMMGQDLMGFHSDSVFRSDGQDSSGKLLYGTNSPTFNPTVRKGPYLPIENANVYRLNEIFENVGPLDGNNYVICDVFTKKRHSGKKTGMPILYYKADKSKKSHDINNPDNPDNIYNYKDNHTLLALDVPDQPDKKHPLFEDPKIFYEMTKDYEVAEPNKPHKADSFILISAGKDGLYGTVDDITNFYWRWKPSQERRQGGL